METKTVFDQTNIEYLAGHLNEYQLRIEIERALIPYTANKIKVEFVSLQGPNNEAQAG